MRLYTLIAFGTRYRPVRRLKRSTVIERVGFAVQGWNRENSHEPGRLPSSGSFTFPGLHAVRRAALEYLADPQISQVAVKTNQSQDIYRYHKQADGSVTGYLSRD